MKTRKATEVERQDYRGNYPLHGWLRHESGVELAVEDLRQDGSWTDPKYEIIAPDGCNFDGERHTIVCFTMADVREHATGVEIVKCSECSTCGCVASPV